MGGHFFETRTRASAVKAEIVSKYFWVWAKIVVKHVRSGIGYVDPFCGLGRYADGAPSTPLLVLARAIADPELAESLRVALSDMDENAVEVLRAEVGKLPGIEKLKHKPAITHREVDDRAVDWLQREWPYPSLVFLDPWGYKGLTLRLIRAGLSRRFTDVIFFFNYNRVNAAIRNEFMRGHIAALLTPERLERLRHRVEGLSPEEREKLVVAELKDEITAGGRHYWQAFRFTSAEMDKTSHYIILATKNPAGLKPMKDIMAAVSSEKTEGVASMSLAPHADKQLGLFTPRPRAVLAEELLRRFAGQSLSVEHIFQRHHEGTQYTLKNYQDVILHLEHEGIVTCEPPATERRSREGKPTLAKHVRVRFPSNVTPKN